MFQRAEGLLVDGLVVQNVVSVREGPALHVLAAQPNVDSLLEKRAEREVLSEGPVGQALTGQVRAGLQRRLQTLKQNI